MNVVFLLVSPSTMNTKSISKLLPKKPALR